MRKNIPSKRLIEDRSIPEPNSGCWLWLMGTAARYGRLRVGGESILAHRLSYELWVGSIPDGMWVLHQCDNPACCNPEHLFVGNVKDNNTDRRNKGGYKKYSGNAGAIGEKNANAKISDAQVIEIRSSQERPSVIAKRMNVKTSTICNIRAGRWRVSGAV